MAKFTSTADLNIRLPGGFEAVGVAGTTHRIPDSLATEFERDQAPHIPGFTWVVQDESTAASASPALRVAEIDGSPSHSSIASLVFPNTMVSITSDSATVSGMALSSLGGREVVSTISSAGSARTVDLANGNVFDITLTSATCTITLTGATSGVSCAITIILHQDSAGGRTVAWPAAVSWPGGSAPILSSAASAVDVIVLETVNGGTTWYGFRAGSGGYAEGTSFPAGPSTNQKFYRTDKNRLYFYDGTRWLCTCVHEILIDNDEVDQAFTTSVLVKRMPPILSDGMDMYLEELTTWTNVQGSNSTAAYWDIALKKGSNNSAYGTITTSADSGSVSIRHSVALNAPVGTSETFIYLDVTKVGAPANLRMNAILVYRRVAT